MRCRKCGERWRLSEPLGGGGSPSPGHHLLISLILFGVAAVLWRLVDPLFGGFAAVLGLLMLIMGLCGCGYQPDAGVNRGSRCQQCGTENPIWPWSI